MPCKHRFYDELNPDWEIEHLFVGTFNPCWSKEKNDAVYFYTRFTNDFWYIMPQVFGEKSMMKKELRTNKDCLRAFLQEKKIGITDMIASLNDADEANEKHKNMIFSFKDEYLENFEIIATDYHKIIDGNPGLKGIYLTRKCENYDHSEIAKLWWNIKKYAAIRGIQTAELITPSRGYHVITRDAKLVAWKNEILK